VSFFCFDITFRFVTDLMKRSDEDELKYTEEVIGENFSNYSAWHNRRYAKSLLFQRVIMGIWGWLNGSCVFFLCYCAHLITRAVFRQLHSFIAYCFACLWKNIKLQG
jgi:hypothetical protein